MIEPYYAEWAKARKKWSKKEPFADKVRDAWDHTNKAERFVFALFILSDAGIILFSFIALSDSTLLPAYGIFFAVFLVITAITDRVLVLRDRRIPEWRMEGNVELVEDVRRALGKLGLANCEQVRIVRDEAIRLLERKEHRHETIVHGALEVVVLAALVCVFNFLVTGLEYNLMPEIAGMLAGAAIFASVIILLLIHGIWIAADCFGGLPVSQLRLFVDDLSCLLVEGARTPSPVRLRPRRRRRTMQH